MFDFLKKVTDSVGLTEKPNSNLPKKIEIDIQSLMPTLEKCSSTIFAYQDCNPKKN
jgi:hypothetical protein